MAAVEAGLSGASASITGLGRALSGSAFIKHKIKRMDRLVGSSHLGSERVALYGAMTQCLLKSLPLPVILFDWSPLTDDQSQQLLRASLPVDGRAITLYEEVHSLSKLGNRCVQLQFLARLQPLMPPHVTPIAVADSGFRTPFFREVERLGWHWLERIRNRDFIAFADHTDDWLAAKSLYAKATRKPKRLGLAQWVRSNPLSGLLVSFFRPSKGRKHLTAQKQPAKSKYSRQDTKSTHYGLDIACESRIQVERRANLLLIAALVIFALWLVGLSLKGSATERHIWVNSNPKHAPYSVIFLAKIACRYVSFELPDNYLELAQALLVDYFNTLE